MSQSYLSSGNVLASGTELVSQNGAYAFQVTASGNFQIIQTSNKAVLSSTNTAIAGSSLTLLQNGELQVDPQPTWQPNVNPLGLQGPFYLSMDNDGCLRVYPNYSAPPTPPLAYGDAIWNAHNLQGAATNYLSGKFNNGQGVGESNQPVLTSQNGLFTLNLQTDGNLVVYYWLNGNQSSDTARIVCFCPETYGTPARTLYFNNGWLCVGINNCSGPSDYIWLIQTNPNNDVYPVCCLSLDNDGCLRIYPSAAPAALNAANPNTTAIWQSPNPVLTNLMSNPAVVPYPTSANGGFTANQQTMYGVLVQEFNASLRADISDLRTDVYPYPTKYVPSNVYDTVQGLAAPTTFPGTCTVEDWYFVQAQIEAETNTLTSLLEFHTDFNANVSATQTQLKSSFGVAQGYVNTQVTQMGTGTGTPSGLGLLSSFFSGILAVAGAVVPGGDVVCAALGALVGVLTALPDDGDAPGDQVSGAVLGEESAFENSFNTVMANALTQAGNIYPGSPGGLATPIASDWGKLQQYYQLLGANALATGSVDYTAVSNQFEIAFYQMIMKSFIALVQWTCTDSQVTVATPISGSVSGLYFSYLPSQNSEDWSWPYSLDDSNGQGNLWDRLTKPTSNGGLGIPAATITGTVANGGLQNWWTCLPCYTGLQQWTNFGLGGWEFTYTLQAAAT